MRRTTILRSAALGAVAALVLTACGGGSSSSSGSSASEGGFKVPNLTALDKLGTPEGEVSVLAWPGYVEDGSNDPKVDWVSDFEKESGCKVTVKTFGTSDEAVQLFRTGQYDTVSASGDATLRLIASGDVEPVNTDLISNYPDIFDSLKMQPWNSVRGVAYGIPHGRGANLLMWRTDQVKPAPDSWSAVFDQASSQKGKVTAYDSPIYIADAALYLMATKPDLGIKNPYALDAKQLAAAVDLLKAQKANVGEYWSDYLKETQAFKNGSSTVGTTWQVIANLAAGGEGACPGGASQGRRDRLVRHVDGGREVASTRPVPTNSSTTSSRPRPTLPSPSTSVRPPPTRRPVPRRSTRTTAPPSTRTTRSTSRRCTTGPPRSRRASMAVRTSSAPTTPSGPRRGQRSGIADAEQLNPERD